MAKKSVAQIGTVLVLLLVASCSSIEREQYKNLKSTELLMMEIIPKLQDNSAMINDANGQRTAILIPGGLLLTASLEGDLNSQLLPVDFSHSPQLQGGIVGHNESMSVIRLLSNMTYTNAKGLSFSGTNELSGTGLFISFSDPNAPRPAIRLVRDLSNPLDAFQFDDLDNGGAFVNMKGELCGLYSHQTKKFIGPKDFRRMWLNVLKSN
ncbi:hypothetical protein PQO01_08445 [Lentisphaera marina]|uniref:hypothetical protein n=1 Tax=Lentisphaera marina TaxID=1111041 RepID=UPI002365EA81|nr:hypothetical protein [Lentisphaera marina]MDD7984973.1 hypothetical protein [Lentisphaera marina]